MSLLTSCVNSLQSVYLSLLPTFQLGFCVTVVERKSCLYTFRLWLFVHFSLLLFSLLLLVCVSSLYILEIEALLQLRHLQMFPPSLYGLFLRKRGRTHYLRYTGTRTLLSATLVRVPWVSSLGSPHPLRTLTRWSPEATSGSPDTPSWTLLTAQGRRNH